MIQHSVSAEDHGCNYLDKIQWLLNVIGVRGHFLTLKNFSEFVFLFLKSQHKPLVLWFIITASSSFWALYLQLFPMPFNAFSAEREDIRI